MEGDDFYSLRVGQFIYYKNKKYKIIKKSLDEDEDCSFKYISICSNDEILNLNFSDMIGEYSLNPPKEKKKYWPWVVKLTKYSKPHLVGWYDDEGNGVVGDDWDAYNNIKWNDIEKKKIESVFWEE